LKILDGRERNLEEVPKEYHAEKSKLLEALAQMHVSDYNRLAQAAHSVGEATRHRFHSATRILQTRFRREFDEADMRARAERLLPLAGDLKRRFEMDSE